MELNLKLLKPKFLDVMGVRTCYYEQGNGNPLLLLPTFPLLAAVEFPLLESLAKFYKVFCFDFPGYGESGKLTGGQQYGLDFYASFVAEFINKVVGKPIDVYGWSTGGVIALLLTLKHQKFVKKLIVQSPPANSKKYGKQNIQIFDDALFFDHHSLIRRLTFFFSL